MSEFRKPKVLTTSSESKTPAVAGRSATLVARLLEDTGVSCEVVLSSGQLLRFGAPPACFRVVLHSDRVLRGALDEFSFGRAYVEGEVDIEGDMLSLFEVRHRLRDRTRFLPLAGFLFRLFVSAPTVVNRRAISAHYNFGDDFYLTFIDKKYRFYSHGIFHSEDETLEQASEHKLEQMWEALQLRPGMRLLDIGAGWGGVTQYCADRGVQVTSLTIAEDSYRYVHKLIQDAGLSADVYREDFLEHRPAEPYDAIVIFGVIEHIPNYRRFCQRVWECLRPGGLIYLDASASKEKFQMSSFTRHYIWQGTHTFLCVQDLVAELLYNGLELLRVSRESHDYELTMLLWARQFDANRDEIVARWGEAVYRAFRVYLWGGCHAFRVDDLQAYHLVARRRADQGPRPGMVKRCTNFLLGLV